MRMSSSGWGSDCLPVHGGSADARDRLGVGPVRDLGLLESAAHRPTTSLWGQEAYPALKLKAAALMDSLVNSHPLVDGNKRLG